MTNDARPRRSRAAVVLLAAGTAYASIAFSFVRSRPSPDAPQAALSGLPRPDPADRIEAAIRRGVDFLIERQNPDGSWGSARRTKGLNIYAPVPGAHRAFRAAVTALAALALVESGADAQSAIRRAEDWLLAHLPQVRRATPDVLYNVWAHAYGIQALARLAERAPVGPRRREMLKIMQDQVRFLERFESVDGGWGYYDFRIGSSRPASASTSFTTATVLVALAEARRLDVKVPEGLVRRAIASIHRQQKPDFSYLYSENLKWWPAAAINRPAGSLGRSQVCNAALAAWGDERITPQVARGCLDRLIARNEWLGMGRKRPVPHESWFQVAGYFYYYGHYYAGLAIQQLAPRERPRYRARLAAIIIALQEKNGSWWDYPLYDYHQAYGTAFALMTLASCRPAAGPDCQ